MPGRPSSSGPTLLTSEQNSSARRRRLWGGTRWGVGGPADHSNLISRRCSRPASRDCRAGGRWACSGRGVLAPRAPRKAQTFSVQGIPPSPRSLQRWRERYKLQPTPSSSDPLLLFPQGIEWSTDRTLRQLLERLRAEGIETAGRDSLPMLADVDTAEDLAAWRERAVAGAAKGSLPLGGGGRGQQQQQQALPQPLAELLRDCI